MRILFALFICSNLFGQIGTGQWRLHVPNKNSLDVVVANNIVYSAFKDGILEYDIENSEKSLWTNVNGLSDISITCLGLDQDNQAVYIGYENGNIDQLKNNHIENIPAIKLAQINNSKRINKIISFNNYIYIATNFSIIKFDPVKFEVRETYYPTQTNDPILDISFKNDSIFALTEKKLLKSNINNTSLADYTQWNIDTRVPINTNLTAKYSEIEVIDNQFYLLYSLPDYGKDTVYCVKNSGLDLVFNKNENFEINSINILDNKLAINIDAGVKVLNSDYTLSKFYGVSGVSSNRSFLDKNSVWIADKYSGLVRFINEYGEHIDFQGPTGDKFYSVECSKDKLIVSSGGMNGHNMTWNTSGTYIFQDENWTSFDRNSEPMWLNTNFWDNLTSAINPNNTDQLAVGTFSEIPLTIFENGKTASKIYTVENSPIESTMWNSEAMISALKYDELGNLWIGNGFCSNPLKVLTKDQKWQTINLGSNCMNKSINKIVIDYNGNKWLAVPSVGLVGLKDNKTIETLSDDKIKIVNTTDGNGGLPSNQVTALAADFNNEIWIGTESGFAILYNSDNIFTSTSAFNAQRIKLSFEGENEYLLGKTYITDIEVDGGNRKWFGTANTGVFLLSPDGNEIIQNFTTDNSPLISNVILDMAFNHKTGELFIATDKGLVSYRADASEGDTEYSNVKVFPNPVKPNFNGLITIQGIQFDSDINVTDVAGNLVYKTTSNGGTATWDGKTVNGQRVKGGVYLFWTAPNETDGKGRKVGKVVVVN